MLICEQNSIVCFFPPSSFFLSFSSFGRNFPFKVIAANYINTHNKYYNDSIVDNDVDDNSTSNNSNRHRRRCRVNKRRQTSASFLMNYMFYSITLSLSRVATKMLFNIKPFHAKIILVKCDVCTSHGRHPPGLASPFRIGWLHDFDRPPRGIARPSPSSTIIASGFIQRTHQINCRSSVGSSLSLF